MSKTPKPTNIKLHQKSRVLEITFDDGEEYNLSCEFLRVYSPSAEVRGHGPGEEVLQFGKQDVNITNIEPVGSYGVCLLIAVGSAPTGEHPIRNVECNGVLLGDNVGGTL